MPSKALALKPSTLIPYAIVTAAMAAASFFASTVFAAETYTLDKNHTNILWHIDHFGFSSPSGRFGLESGSLVLDEKNPANSSVNVVIDMDDLETGIDAFDEHVESKDFLDTDKYPTATFKSTKVETTGANTAKVSGNLTLHGVTKPVVLDVKLNKLAPNPMSQVKTAGFSATTTIKRSEFGISMYVPNVSDEVRLSIESEANLASATPAKK